MYQFDALVDAYDSIGVIGSSTSVGVSTRVKRLNLSAQEIQKECQIHDLGNFIGQELDQEIQYFIVMSPAGAAPPDQIINELNRSGRPFSIQNIKENSSFTPEHESYLSTDLDLLIELEKLLALDNPVRVLREQYRAQLTESIQMPEVRSVLVDGEVQEVGQEIVQA